MQFDQRQLPQKVAPIQQQSVQPQMPPSPSSSSSSSSPMSQQLLQLVFLQQQQLQQIQSAILGKMEVGKTTKNLLAQPQQHQSVVEPAAGMQYNNARNSGQAMDYGNASMQFMNRTSNYNYYNGNEQSGMQYNGRTGQPMDYGEARTAPRMAMRYENRTNNYGYDYISAPQPTGMQYNNGRYLGQAMDYDGRVRTAPRMASPQYQEERIFNSNYTNKNSMMRPGMQYRGEWWQRNAAGRNMASVDQATSNRKSNREARNAQSEPYFSQLLDDYE